MRRLRPALPWVPRALFALTAALIGASACANNGSSPTGPDPDPDPGAYDHRLGTGMSAADLLGASDFDSLVVQVHYAPGHQPTAAGLDELTAFLDERLNKPRGISVDVDSIPVSPRATWSVAQVAAVEQEHRIAFAEGRTLALYFLFLDGEFDENENVLGFALLQHVDGNLRGENRRQHGEPARAVGCHRRRCRPQARSRAQPRTRRQPVPDADGASGRAERQALRRSGLPDVLVGAHPRLYREPDRDGPELDQDCLDALRANGGR